MEFDPRQKQDSPILTSIYSNNSIKLSMNINEFSPIGAFPSNGYYPHFNQFKNIVGSSSNSSFRPPQNNHFYKAPPSFSPFGFFKTPFPPPPLNVPFHGTEIPPFAENHQLVSHDQNQSLNFKTPIPPPHNVHSHGTENLPFAEKRRLVSHDQNQSLNIKELKQAEEAATYTASENVRYKIRAEEKKRKRSDIRTTCRVRKPPSSSASKGAWNTEEDNELIEMVKLYGIKRWSVIAKVMGGRAGKQCRERWHNHLRPDIKKTPWTEEEEKILIKAHIKLGNKWAEMSNLIEGRTESTIKNHWNATKRRLQSIRKHKNCTPTSSIALQDYIKHVLLDEPYTDVLDQPNIGTSGITSLSDSVEKYKDNEGMAVDSGADIDNMFANCYRVRPLFENQEQEEEEENQVTLPCDHDNAFTTAFEYDAPYNMEFLMNDANSKETMHQKRF